LTGLHDFRIEALAKPSRTQAVRLASGRFFAGFLMMRRGAAEHVALQQSTTKNGGVDKHPGMCDTLHVVLGVAWCCAESDVA
jgi:hypothetical protein